MRTSAARGLFAALSLLGSAALGQTGTGDDGTGDGAQVGPRVVAPQGTPADNLIRSPVLTIDPDRLFAASDFGQRLTNELNSQSEALAAENREIEAALTEEERDLTERRPSMDQDSFRAEAAAFDEKVVAIRRAQDAKERALEQRLAAGRDRFFQEIQPIVGRLMIERGAGVVLDRRSAFLSIGVIDITDLAIAAINTEIGDGADDAGTE